MPDSKEEPDPAPIRVVVVDDHRLLVESLVRLLVEDPAVLVVGTEPTALAGIDTAVRERADMVLMDYALPDLDGASATRLLLAELPSAAVIMITGSERPGAYSAAMEAGCAGFVRKTRAFHDLLDAIHRVSSGEQVLRTRTRSCRAWRTSPSTTSRSSPSSIADSSASRLSYGGSTRARDDHARQVPSRGRGDRLCARHRSARHLKGAARPREVAEEPANKTPLWVSVNMSAVGLSVPDIAQQLEELLIAAEVDPARLVIEITETALLEDTPEIAANIRALKSVGVKLALDDFGTAFSSLSYLRRFPFDHVKIDTSFTAELPHTPRAVLLVESIRQLAVNMGSTGIAEGIERPEQAACLIENGWELGQGFLYSEAVPFAQASEMVRRRRFS